MNDMPTHVLNPAEVWLCITTIAYFFMNGAQIFETFVIIPKWTASPPESFQYFRGKYGMDLKTFWIILHSAHEITFMLAIYFCWHKEVRNCLIMLFVLHFIVRVWTIIYFAPNIMEFQKIANLDGGTGAGLAEKVIRWRRLNYIRVAAFGAISIGLVFLCAQLLQLRW